MSIGDPFDTGHICDWVDAILLAKKAFRGKPGAWRKGNGPNDKRVDWPVEVEGELIGLYVTLTAYPSEPSLRYTVTLNLQVPGWPRASCIWRIDHEPLYKHHPARLADILNGVAADTDLRGPHFHSWERNRYLCKPTAIPLDLERADPLPSGMRFDQTLRWFCGKARITLAKEYMVELPRPDTFL